MMIDGDQEAHVQPDHDLEARLAAWREEQFRVAEEVVVLPDETSEKSAVKEVSSRYKVLTDSCFESTLFGGVDVSFPEAEGDPAVAVYCILRGDKVLYHDSEMFTLEVPYVSSYLSFREIDPLERLVKKQMSEQPELTPYAILVDGNGILHQRNAGIACFLGVRTGLKTIGVGKTLYCHAGLSTTLVMKGIDKALAEFVHQTREDDEFRRELQGKRGVVYDQFCISAEISESNSQKGDKNLPKTEDRQSVVQELSIMCQGFAMKLKGNDGKICGSALLAHGGSIGRRSRGTKCGTKNPIFVSVGNLISLEEAVHICAKLSQARIPEPVRQADLSGRDLLRRIKKNSS